MNAQGLASFIWSIAELLRGDYKQSDYGKVILPFTVLRRLDCVLEPTKAAVLKEFDRVKLEGLPPEQFLLETSDQSFFNSSPMDMSKLLGDAANLSANIVGYVNGFSENVRDIFDKFEFEKQIERLDANNLLFLVVQKFASVDLHPKAVNNAAMGHLFEELIRRFAELSNETAGEHFTPREVIRLMVNLLFLEDDAGLTTTGAVRTIYDPTAGTGGMLSIAEEHLLSMNPKAKLAMHGQELNPESYAICKADMLVKGQDVSNIVFGNTLSNDGHAGKKFDYMLSNPPFGVDWKKVEAVVRKEHEGKGHAGRFGPGLPRVSDGSLLFLMHLVSKMRDPSVGGSRIGIVLNGSPLFTGGAGSGESEIRKYLFENDLVEAIVALPTDMFYNTGIGTYVWILSNKKSAERTGRVQLIDASSFFVKMRKSLGNKRKEMSESDIADITHVYGECREAALMTPLDLSLKNGARNIVAVDQVSTIASSRDCGQPTPVSKVLRNEDFGYRTVTVDRPLRLRYQITPAAFDAITIMRRESKAAFLPDQLAMIESVINDLGVGKTWPTRKLMSADLGAAFARLNISPPMQVRKFLDQMFSVRHADGEVKLDSKGRPEADPDLRDTEDVPLSVDVEEFVTSHVKPFFPDCWIDTTKTKIGYDIPFSRHFYIPIASRSLDEIDADIRAVLMRISRRLEAIQK